MDAELVNEVTEQVIAALRRRGVGVRGAAAAHAAEPPRQMRSASQANPPGLRKVFVTEEMLGRRLEAGAEGGVIELRCNEFLTPSAEDLAARRHLTIRRMPDASPPPCTAPAVKAAVSGAKAPLAGPARRAPSRAIGIFVERCNEKVAGLLRALRYDEPALTDCGGDDCPIINIRGMSEAIVAGNLAGGVAVMRYAADAVVLANKIRGIRAVQGTRAESVAAAIRHFGANLLILEHAFSTFHEMRRMIRVFAAGSGTPGAAGALLEAISELER